MQLDVNRYSLLLPIVKRLIELNPTLTDCEMANLVTTGTQAPIVASCYIVAHFMGMSPELEQKTNHLISFYKYDNIIMLEVK